jgi:hypothetical protein
MRRFTVALLVIFLLPQIPVTADEIPFNLYVDSEIVAHPGETVQFRIGWHNIVGFERHLGANLDSADEDLNISSLPIEAYRVASGRQGGIEINITVDAAAPFGTQNFNFTVSCVEVPNWSQNFTVEVLVSRWSMLNFGANDGSSFYVQQGVRTTLAMNVSNTAGFDDFVKVRINTASSWDFGFSDDVNGDGEVHLDLLDGENEFVSFWIEVPPIVDGAPLAGTGPSFTLEAESGLDRRVANWTFSLDMQTWFNLTIDAVESDLSLNPGGTGRLDVTVRNNGNTASFLDARLRIGSEESDRFESEGWTIAVFDNFQGASLEPNESRTIEVGFSAPNVNSGELRIEFLAAPTSISERTRVASIGSFINWERGGELFMETDQCTSIQVDSNCVIPLQINNTGNFWDSYSLELFDVDGISATIDAGPWSIQEDGFEDQIELNLSTLEGAEGLAEGSLTIRLIRGDGVIIDIINFETITAPHVEWVWENSSSEVDSTGRLNVVMTLRNEGNIMDGLIVRMTSSHFTEMSFVPPEGAWTESEEGAIRSFEMIDIEKGENFTFRAYAVLPTDQIEGGNLFLNITAHSRLAEENPFVYTANSTFDGKAVEAADEPLVDVMGIASAIGYIVWAWKWIIMATMLGGLMINKSVKDRRARIAEAARNAPPELTEEEPEDWMAEFHGKRQGEPIIADSPEMPAEVFTGMFHATSGPKQMQTDPVAQQLVGAASTVVDHHDKIFVKDKMDNLAFDVATGQVSTPHHANVALPDDLEPETSRTNPVTKEIDEVPSMFDIDDLDL